MQKQIVVFIAPPGAGKGTQAELLAQKFGFYQLETSKIIEQKFKEADPNDARLQEEKKRWLAGELTDPHLVVDWFCEKIHALVDEGQSLVLSGSLRTLYETEKMLPVLDDLVGQDNLKIFHITLSEEESIKRNVGRRICEKNRHPVPNFPEYKDTTVCPWDGSRLVKRALDKPDIIKERYQVYKKETEPVFNYLEKQNHEVITINGEQSIEKVSEDILKYF
jgi:adenylate kinase